MKDRQSERETERNRERERDMNWKKRKRVKEKVKEKERRIIAPCLHIYLSDVQVPKMYGDDPEII